MNLVRAVASRPLYRSITALVGCGLFVAPACLLAQRAPNVDVWFDQGNEFDRGQPGRVMYSGDAGSYVTVLRVNTDGRVTVLSPSQPNSRSKYAGGRIGTGIPFQADPSEGVGYVFAVASETPFDFRNYRTNTNRWNMGTLGERSGVDPFEIVDRFARSSVGRRGTYSIAYAPYEIGRAGAGRAAYSHGVRYDDGYGGYSGGYDDPWGASPYRRDYDNYQYQGGYGSGYGNGYGDRSGNNYRNNYDNRGYSNRGYGGYGGYGGYNGQYSQDPRTRALRHCPDGTLAPYTTPCAAFARPGNKSSDGYLHSRDPLPRPTPQPRPGVKP
ncbi:MAG: hypothetical protein ABI035_01895 [Gemmatimonadaceae bacterium]